MRTVNVPVALVGEECAPELAEDVRRRRRTPAGIVALSSCS